MYLVFFIPRMSNVRICKDDNVTFFSQCFFWMDKIFFYFNDLFYMYFCTIISRMYVGNIFVCVLSCSYNIIIPHDSKSISISYLYASH